MNFWELLVIVAIGILTIVQYSLPGPIIPLQFKHRDISQTSTGVAIASYSIGYIVGSIIPSEWLYRNRGRRKIAQYGFLALSISLFLYGISYFIPDQYQVLFYIASIITRVIEGLSTSIILSAIISLISIIYPTQRGRALSARACGSYLGMSLGGVIGGSLFNVLGYFGVFMTFSVILFLTIFLLYVFKQAKGDNSQGSEEDTLTLCQFLKQRRSIITLICNGLLDILLYTLEPTLAIKLRTDFNFSTFIIGLYFFLFFLGGAITMTTMIALPEHWDKRKFILPSIILTALFSFMVGPSTIFFMPNSPLLMGFGIFFHGAARGICMALTPIDAITGGIQKFSQRQARVSDLVSQIYTFILGVAMITFPVVGSALVQAIGFRLTIDLMSILMLFTAIAYLISTIIDWRREKQQRNEQFKRSFPHSRGEDEQIGLMEAEKINRSL